MIKKACCLTILFVLGCTDIAWTQHTASPYFLDGNDVVFRFDLKEYAHQLSKDEGKTLDFRDLNIHDVAISGDFNQWNKKGWRLNKINESSFELRKPIKSFNDKFPIEFRYIINGEYQHFLPGYKNFRNSELEEVYSLDLSVLKLNPNGKIRFYLSGHENAGKVILAGSFNNWDEQSITMNKIQGGWELRGDLPAGRYEYKFIIDGHWTEDPGNPEYVRNEHGTFNSVLTIVKMVGFQLHNYTSAKTVSLAGDFTNWGSDPVKMNFDGKMWYINVPLGTGKHAYKFIVDNKWITDPANPIEEDDGHGNLNSIIFVH